MGDVIQHVQTATISTGGSYTFTYTHDPKGKPSKCGLIAVYLASGTQTGKVSIRYGNDPINVVEIGGASFTATDPSCVVEPEFVLQPGQVIQAVLSTITAGDVARFMVEGH